MVRVERKPAAIAIIPHGLHPCCAGDYAETMKLTTWIDSLRLLYIAAL